MITDKEGKEVTLKEILGYLTGTDEDDMAKSVIDFAVYPVNEEDKSMGDPQYYLIASEAIVTQISFMGPFVMVELDFRNIGINILNQVLNVVNKFHTDINYDSLIMLSTITSLDKNATHLMSLANPLICVRGYSIQGEGSTILQMVYATDNVAFHTYEIDYKQIDADIEREIKELESMQVSNEAMQAAQEIIDENNEIMSQMFKPEFGIRTPEDKKKQNDDNVRVTYGKETAKIHSRNNERIGNADNSRVQDVREIKEDE